MKQYESLEPRTLLSYPVTLGGSAYDTVSKVIAMPDGGTVVAGLFTETADFDPTSRLVARTAPEDKADMFIARYTSAGRLSWVRQFSSDEGELKTSHTIDTPTDPECAGPFDLGVGISPANLGIYVTGLAVDSIGNIYFAGAFRGSVNFGTNASPRVMHSQGGGDFINTYFGRLNAHGGLSFVRQINADFTNVANDLKLDSSNNVYLTGYFTRDANFNVTGGALMKSTQGREDIFTAKYDPVGRLQWVNTASTEETARAKRSAGNALAVDASGNVFVVGLFAGETRFDPAIKSGATTIKSNKNTDAFVEKLNANGTTAWVQGFGGKEFDGATAIALSPDASKVYVGSYFEDTIDANPGTAIQNITATPEEGDRTPKRSDLLLSSFNTTDGTLGFAHTLAGGEGWETLGGLASDSSGNIFATGGFYDATNFGNSTITSTARIEKFRDANDGGRDFSYDVFLAKYDANGAEIFATSFGSASDDYGAALAIDSQNRPIVAGQFRGAYFFPNNAGRLRPLAGQDGFVSIFDPDGTLVSG